MKSYSRVYFSLCLFLAISRRSRTHWKLNPREKFPIQVCCLFVLLPLQLKKHLVFDFYTNLSYLITYLGTRQAQGWGRPDRRAAPRAETWEAGPRCHTPPSCGHRVLGHYLGYTIVESHMHTLPPHSTEKILQGMYEINYALRCSRAQTKKMLNAGWQGYDEVALAFIEHFNAGKSKARQTDRRMDRQRKNWFLMWHLASLVQQKLWHTDASSGNKVHWM